jgi:hypothetical protein
MGMWNDYVQRAMKEGTESSGGFGRANNRSRRVVKHMCKAKNESLYDHCKLHAVGF